jgi:hypothetical protein
MEGSARGDDDQRSNGPPLLFISHRHSDQAIADVVRKFVTDRSGGRIAVFQSSSAVAEGPRSGERLTEELRRSLWRASMVILIYTREDQDWSWCMWECGVATSAESPDTRTIVFQAGARSPSVFAGEVRVNLRLYADVQRFTNEFLTSSSFLPQQREPVAPGFHPNDGNVEQAAQSFYDELQKVLPGEEEDGIEEWPPFPFLQLELAADQVKRICDEQPDRRPATTADVLDAASVIEGDQEAARIFGTPSIRSGIPFQDLVRPWKETFDQPSPSWLDGLARQVMMVAQWRFPTLRWELMRAMDENDGTWYAPVVNCVRRMPSQAIQFDIYFDKFELDEQRRSVKVGIPANA